MKLALLAFCAVLPGAIADAGDCTVADYVLIDDCDNADDWGEPSWALVKLRSGRWRLLAAVRRVPRGGRGLLAPDAGHAVGGGQGVLGASCAPTPTSLVAWHPRCCESRGA